MAITPVDNQECSYRNRLELLDYLVKNNIQTELSETMLSQVSAFPHLIDLMRYFDKNAVAYDSDAVFELAVQFSQLEVVKLLIGRGVALPVVRGPLVNRCQVEFLMRLQGILDTAIESRDLEMIRVLCEAGAEVDATSYAMTVARRIESAQKLLDSFPRRFTDEELRLAVADNAEPTAVDAALNALFCAHDVRPNYAAVDRAVELGFGIDVVDTLMREFYCPTSLRGALAAVRRGDLALVEAFFAMTEIDESVTACRELAEELGFVETAAFMAKYLHDSAHDAHDDVLYRKIMNNGVDPNPPPEPPPEAAANSDGSFEEYDSGEDDDSGSGDEDEDVIDTAH